MRDKKEARQSFYRTCKIISHKLIWINILLLGYHKMTLNQFVKKIESGNSVYSDRYYIKHDSSGKTPVSKPNGSKKDNLE